MGQAKKELIEKLDELKIYLKINDVDNDKIKERCDIRSVKAFCANEFEKKFAVN